MKLLVMLVFLVLFLQNISAIIINEIEINPLEGVSGKEWIELYNDEEREVDISGWAIWEGLATPKKRYTLPENTTISSGEYFVIELSSARILNNNGDFVTLYDVDETKIDETPELVESESSSKTWQLCNEWEFLDTTQGEENNCPEEQEEDQEDEENETENQEEEIMDEEELIKENSQDEEITSLSTDYSEEETKERAPIEAKHIKSEDNNENQDKTDYAKYGLFSFCILLIVLFLIKRKNQKTEFEE